MADSYAEPQSRTETVVAIQYLRAVAAGLIAFQHAMGVPAFVTTRRTSAPSASTCSS